MANDGELALGEEYHTLDRMMQNRTSQTLTAVSILLGGSLVAFGQLVFSGLRGLGAVGLDLMILSLLIIAFFLYLTTYRLNRVTMQRLRKIETLAFQGEGAYSYMYDSIKSGKALEHRVRSSLWFAALALLILATLVNLLWILGLLKV